MVFVPVSCFLTLLRSAVDLRVQTLNSLGVVFLFPHENTDRALVSVHCTGQKTWRMDVHHGNASIEGSRVDNLGEDDAMEDASLSLSRSIKR